MNRLTAIHGAILGTVIGDAIGLPYEALSKRRGIRLLGVPDRHRFLLGRGMMSDDGEHTCMVAQSLCDSGGDVEQFRSALSRRLRLWLLGLPAGIGGATLRATLKLSFGVSPRRSGVFSAGNGPAMRSAVLGAAIGDIEQLRRFVEASTLITHTDPKAFYGAMAVALAARAARNAEASGYVGLLRATLPDAGAVEFIELITDAERSAKSGEQTTAFAARIGAGRGVSGYIYQTVPVAIHAWLRHSADFATAVGAAIECGGDTDTVAAIVGGIIGASLGAAGIPEQWKKGLLEWPRSPAWIERLARCVDEAMASQSPMRPPRVGWSVLPRNLLFIFGVGIHLIRRAAPPY